MRNQWNLILIIQCGRTQPISFIFEFLRNTSNPEVIDLMKKEKVNSMETWRGWKKNNIIVEVDKFVKWKISIHWTYTLYFSNWSEQIHATEPIADEQKCTTYDFSRNIRTTSDKHSQCTSKITDENYNKRKHLARS